jgi:hypothetical protein
MRLNSPIADEFSSALRSEGIRGLVKQALSAQRSGGRKGQAEAAPDSRTERVQETAIALAEVWMDRRASSERPHTAVSSNGEVR